MNDDRITSLVSELITHDETLKEHEADLRILVSHMLAEKPKVVPNTTFAQDLRTRLLSNRLRAVLSPYQHVERWAFRLVPLGMVALLVLMLFPERTHYIPRTTETDDMGAPPAVVDVGTYALDPLPSEGSETSERSMPVPAFSGGESVGTMDSSNSEMTTESSMAPGIMSKVAPSPVPLPFTIDPQASGPRVVVREATVTAPSFIVLYTYDRKGNEVVFGISPLLRAGSTENVPIYTQTRTQKDGTYMARLHTDNGNGLFTLKDDVPLTDSYGNPVIVSVVIE
jgi:hypothetical protein